MEAGPGMWELARRASEKAAAGVPDGAGLTRGQTRSGSILKAEPQDFLMDGVWSVTREEAQRTAGFLAKHSNQDETDINGDGKRGARGSTALLCV